MQTHSQATHDDGDRDVRLAFMRIDAQTTTTLREFWKIVEPALPNVLDGFYSLITGTPQLAKLIGDQTPRLKKAQGTHWHRLFNNGFGQDYVQSVRSIGLVHNRIGLEPRWYIGGYNFVLRELLDLAVRTYRWKPAKLTAVLQALTSAVNLDMDFAISVYQEAMLAERQQRQTKLDEAIRAFSVSMGKALETGSGTADQMQKTATGLTATAEETSRQATAVAAASEQSRRRRMSRRWPRRPKSWHLRSRRSDARSENRRGSPARRCRRRNAPIRKSKVSPTRRNGSATW